MLASAAVIPAMPARAADEKPNVPVIFGDDIGQANISTFTRGLVGHQTPNIDRIAREGTLLTDHYAEQSCTAGRSTFITGQVVYRAGLSKVGLPAAAVGRQKEDPTIAELLKPLGYATGRFGGNHLNAEEEPELFNYPQDPRFRQMFGPRGVLRLKATDRDDPTVDRASARSAGRPSRTPVP